MRLIASLVVAASLALTAAATQEVVFTTWADCGDGSKAVYSGDEAHAQKVAERYDRKGCITTITFWPDWVQ
jgi:hypothetical protein